MYQIGSKKFVGFLATSGESFIENIQIIHTDSSLYKNRLVNIVVHAQLMLTYSL